MQHVSRTHRFIEDGLPYRLETVTFVPEQAHGVVVSAYGVPRGTENDKSYVPDRFAPYIAEAGFIATAHSPEGLGRSGGDTGELTLAKRTAEVVAVAERAAREHVGLPLCLYGSSMGAHLVIKAAHQLAEQGIEVDDLIIVSPAAYPDEAEQATFGEPFKAAITGAHQNGHETFGVLKILEVFPGRVVLAWAEGDPVEKGGPLYPNIIAWFDEVMERRAAAGRRDLRIVVPGVEHSFRIEGKGIEESPASLAAYRSFCERFGSFITQQATSDGDSR